MDVILYTNQGAAFVAALVQTALASSKLKLYKSGLTLTPATTQAELAAAECDFTGYTTGGETITAWLAPILAPEGGYAIQSPLEQWIVGATPTGNIVGGWWVEETGGAVIVAAQFATPVPMEVTGQGLPISVRLVFPN